jgi:hypothetical protein
MKEILKEEKDNNQKMIDNIQKELSNKNKLVNDYQNRYENVMNYLENTILNEFYNKNENMEHSINHLIDDYKSKNSNDKSKKEFDYIDVLNIIEKGVKSFIEEKEELKSSLEEAHKIIDLQHEKIESVNEENNNLLDIMNKEKIKKDQENLEYSLTPSNNNSKHSLLGSISKVNLSKNIENESTKSLIHSSSNIGINKLNLSATFNNSMISLDPILKDQINTVINTNSEGNINTIKLKSILNSLYEKYNVLEQTYHLVNQRLEYQKSANQDIKKMIVTAQIGKTLDNNDEKYNKSNDELIMKKYCDLLEKNNELTIELEQKQLLIENLQESLNNK